MNSIDQRIVQLKNEIRSQKVAGEIAYSSFLAPSNTPSTSVSERIGWNLRDNQLFLRERFRFQRTDGSSEPPLVNFTFSFELNPDMVTYYRNEFGITVSGYDTNATKNIAVTGYIYETGNGYVDFYVDVDYNLAMEYQSQPPVDITMRVQAISLVNGTINATRLL